MAFELLGGGACGCLFFLLDRHFLPLRNIPLTYRPSVAKNILSPSSTGDCQVLLELTGTSSKSTINVSQHQDVFHDTAAKILSACRFWRAGKLDHVNHALAPCYPNHLLFIRYSSFVASSDLLFLPSMPVVRADEDHHQLPQCSVELGVIRWLVDSKTYMQ